MSQTEKNMANQRKELLLEYVTKRNQALETSLDIARNTWRTIDSRRGHLENKTHFLVALSFNRIR
jgi:hypothetical protein